MKRYETLSVFPEFFDTYTESSILGRAQDMGLFEFQAHNLRDWTHDIHNSRWWSRNAYEGRANL